MKKQQLFFKNHIAENMTREFERAFNSFNDDEFEIVMLNKIRALKSKELATLLSVSEDMGRKYLSGHSLPSLTGAVHIEEAFSIPAKYWVIYQKKHTSSKS